MERAGLYAGPSRLAVVGFAFRFPGPPGEGFWAALREGRDLIGALPDSRWPAASFYHPRRSEPGATYTLAGGSIGDIDGFDAAFFGLSPREAAQLDPQQRLLLELAWEAFEAGGIPPSSVRGSRASVTIGFSGSDLSHRMTGDLAAVDAFSMTGVAGSIAANRLSYFFDLRGPSMALDTACSSSLVAFHQACESILRGESELAVAGAVSLHLHPFPYIAFSKAGMLSRRGVCAPFDAQADGYVRSEGAGIVLLKRLEDARAAGNRVFAVVAGSAVNSDGKTAALTVPSGEAQAALLREVYSRACIDPAEIDYVEAHGTGTAVGDPIEARALGEAIGRLRGARSPLRIGSVKSNLGHLETAAGMAGLVKAIYCLRDRVIPPSIHFATPNPQIAFRDWNLSVVTESTPLEPGRRAVIGINSFGFGGANAHVILESGDDWSAAPRAAPPRPEAAVPLVLSARSEEALRAAALDHAQWLGERRDLALHDLAWSAAFHRERLEHRAVLFGADRGELARALEKFGRAGPGAASAGVVAGRALAKPGAPVFVYCGNGSQWAGMGRKLLAESPEFARAIAEVDACLERRCGFSVRAALAAGSAADLEATELAQPLLFAVQVGLTGMLRAWGVAPGAVLGHSVGEIAAAWACGALPLEEAARVVAERSAAQGKTRGTGAMTALAMPEDEARALLARSESGRRLAVAAVNSPASVTLAGARRDLEAFEQELAACSATFRRLAIDYGFHSPAMDPVEAPLRRALARLRPAAERLPFYSTVTGERLAGKALDAGYWWRNVREPVRFARAVASLLASGASAFVEIGPHPVLRAPLGECLRRAGGDTRVIATLARSGDGADALREKAFEVLVAGCPVDLARLFAEPGRFVDLPRYPWQRERLERPRSPEGVDPIERPIVHPLLGWRVPGAEAQWESLLDTSLVPELGDHRVGGETLLPASAFAEMALAAAAQAGLERAELHELEIRAPLGLEAQRSKSVRLSLDPADGRFTIRSRVRQSADAWRLHASGRLVAAQPAGEPPRLAPLAGERVAGETHYRLAAGLGLDYGPAFRQVEELWREPHGSTAGVTAKLNSPPALRGTAALVHPASLDACFQLLLHAEGAAGATSAFVPVSIGRLVLYRPGESARFARLEPRRRRRRSVLADCRLYSASGEAIAALEGVRFQAVQLKRPAANLSFIAERRFAKPLGAPAPLPPLEQLAAACRARLHGASRLQARERYFSGVEPLLEAMLGAFAREALAGAGEVPAERRGLARLLAEAAGGVEFPEAREIWRELLREHPDHAEEVIWLGGVGLRLPALLRGEAWRGAGPVCTGQFSQALADIVAEALRALPERRRLRVLVLDAGGSPGLGRILAQLDESRAECVVLSCTTELAAEPGEPFDLVISEQGIGWAREPRRVLEQLRAMTAGVVVLGVPRASRASALARGLLREAGGEALSPGCPESGAQDWPEALRQAGFADCLAVPDAPDYDSGSSLLLARAPSRETREAAPGAWLVLADGEGISAGVAFRVRAELEGRGARVELQGNVPGDPGAFDGVVELRGLGTGLERQAERCASLAGLLEACAALERPPVLWVVTARSHADPAEAPLWGFARTAMNEYPQLALRLADLAEPQAAAAAGALAEAMLGDDGEDEIVVGAAGREVVRAELVDPMPAAAPAPGAIARLDQSTPGQLKGLCWTAQEIRAPGEDEVEIEVRAAGLNFRDVMSASGQLPDEALEHGFAGATLGMELSGVVRSAGPRAAGLRPGDAVIAFAPSSFATRTLTPAGAVVRKPADWSFEAAATVPAAFLTAYYALHHLARLEEGQRVLIHGAAGGVGIAAIQIAQMLGAEIFGTAGSEAKRDFLRLLGVAHVHDSRSLAFAGEVMAATGGEGVDVVLNSLAGEAMSRSLRLLKPFGRFLELGKRDFYEDTRIGLRPLAENIAYFGVDADQLMLRRPDLTRRLMQELMALFRQGQLKPLPYRAFAAADALEAFRFMQQSKHIGKVVLSFDPPPAAKSVVPTQRNFSLDSEKSYLVTGGLRGFGLRTAQWLAGKGARHLVLASRSGKPDAEGETAIAALRAAGVEVKAVKCDVADRGELERLLAGIAATPYPLRGVVHAAALIRDGLVRKLDAAQIEAVLAPKARGAALLDELTRGLALEFFVLFSSATSVFGNPGQAAYVAANRYLEVLAAARRAAGLPALCVGWGPIADAGTLARQPQLREALEARMGGSALEAERALDVLEQLIVRGSQGAAVARFDRGAPRLLSANVSPKLKSLAARLHAGEPAGAESVERWLEELDDERLTALFTEMVKKEVAEILRMAPERVDPRQPLAELGLDSLMGVELMTAVEARFGVNLPVIALAESASIERLVGRIVRELRSGRTAADAEAADEVRLAAARHARDIDPRQLEAIAEAMETKRPVAETKES